MILSTKVPESWIPIKFCSSIAPTVTGSEVYQNKSVRAFILLFMPGKNSNNG